MRSGSPVFFDPSGRRSWVVATIYWGVLIVLAALSVFVVATVVNERGLPRIKLAQGKVAPSDGLSELSSFADEPKVDPRHPRQTPDLAAEDVVRYGYLVNWDDNSFASLRRNAQSLDVAIVEWLHLSAKNGRLKPDDPAIEKRIGAWVKTEAPDLKLYPLINNYDPEGQRWLNVETSRLLQSAADRRTLIDDLARYLKNGAYPGLVLDFEELPSSQRGPYADFVAEAYASLHADGLKLLVAVRPDDESYDLARLADYSDGLIVMLYDEYGEGGMPGPLAGQGWFESRLDGPLKDIDSRKLIVSFGSYGYDWSPGQLTREVSFQESLELLGQSGAQLKFHKETLNPSFTYLGDDGTTRHELWYLDAVTAYNQIVAALPSRPSGLALWRLGTEDPAVWSMFGKGRLPNEKAIHDIAKLRSGYDILYQGQGEALAVSGGTSEGHRTLTLDREQNLLTGETIGQFPKSTTITRWGGGSDKVIALTFDDGPDPTYTPQVLDVLAEKNVKATFFIVGSAGTINQSLVRRIYKEGHDLGNHTFSHVNSNDVSKEQLTLELNATQRLLEAVTGARTRLFRPPYAQDIEPQTIDGASALSLAAELGYITIGMNIDPKDYLRSLPRQIVESVVTSAENGEGKVVLLHDAGGSRSVTVKALPALIDALRARGYTFVTTHELLKIDRAAAMPPAAPDEAVIMAINSLGFTIYSGFGAALTFLFQMGILLGTLRLLVVTAGGVTHNRKRTARLQGLQHHRSVAVLIPAFNEEAVICKSIRTMLSSRLKKFEIIVIDDGSSDRTAEVVLKEFSRTKRVRVFKKENGGKAEALNFGLTKTDAEIVVALDADTVFEPDALGYLLAHFDNPKIGAVAGSTNVGNTCNMITRFQALEYVTSQNLDRRALELVNSITVVPGAIGAWKREAVVAAGGFSSETLAEDADLTMQIELMGWKVVYEPNAVARTEAPDTIRAFMKQRFRWMFGTLQAAWKHRSVMLRVRNGTGIGLFGLPNIFVFQILFTLIAPIVDLMLVWNVVAGVRAYEMNPAGGMPPALASVALYWGLFQLLDLVTAAVAISMEPHARVWRYLPLLLIQRFFYRQLLYVVAFKTALAALKGRMVGWGKLKRTNSVPILSPT